MSLIMVCYQEGRTTSKYFKPEVNFKLLLENDLQRKVSNSERMDLQRVENSNSNSIAVLSAGRGCGWDDRSISLKMIPIRLRLLASRGDKNRSCH